MSSVILSAIAESFRRNGRGVGILDTTMRELRAAGLKTRAVHDRAPNSALDRTAGSHSLAAAGQRGRSADNTR
jgi:hypothetical protein